MSVSGRSDGADEVSGPLHRILLRIEREEDRWGRITERNVISVVTDTDNLSPRGLPIGAEMLTEGIVVAEEALGKGPRHHGNLLRAVHVGRAKGAPCGERNVHRLQIVCADCRSVGLPVGGTYPRQLHSVRGFRRPTG
jgi:hypothetical protein